MRAPLLLALAAVSLGLVGYAISSLQAPPPARVRASESPPAAPEGPRATPRPAAAAPTDEPPIVRIARAARAPEVPSREPEARVDEPAPAPEPSGPAIALPLTRAATEAAFEALVGELEAIEDPRALAPERRAELYRQTNDALAALSTQLGEGEIEALEDAYARVQTQARRLRLQAKP